MSTVLDRVAHERDAALETPVHSQRTAAILGLALGVCFTVSFVTGLYSHLLQHPISWLAVPTRPVGLYRVNQGVHVATGIASVPLLLAKLWSVYPKLFAWPPIVSVAQGVERLTLIPLVCGSALMLFTGIGNIEHWYPWPFFFTNGHYWVAWITIGALMMHVGAKAATTRRVLARGATAGEAAPAPGQLGRRGFLAAVGVAAGGLTLTTVGEAFDPLRRFVLFAPRRPDFGSQGLPVNGAPNGDVQRGAADPAYRLTVTGAVATPLSLTTADLEARALQLAELPIACVEGWSKSASWRGVRVRDLLHEAGVPDDRSVEVDVRSLEVGGLYGQSTLSSREVRDGDTLLATHLNGERLNLDHGYPVRLIAPNRPGVLQTKWVTELVVR